MRTKFGFLKCLICEPYLEPSTLLALVEFRDSQARAIHGYGIPYIAVIQNRRGVGYRERASTCIAFRRRDSTEVLNLIVSAYNFSGGSAIDRQRVLDL